MRKFATVLLLLALSDFATVVFAQRPQIKFGDVKPEDFSPAVYSVDSSASGVVLFDVGSSVFEGNSKGSFSINFKRHTRIRLLNRNSFDLASLTIPLYASGTMEERIESLEATTYNLENGKVVANKLDKNSIFKDRLNKNFTVRKFTLPNLKEGSIIEIKYNFLSPYFQDLRSWEFQGDHPVLWSEYAVTIPAFYDFVTIRQGYHPYKIEEGKLDKEAYNIFQPGRGVISFTTDVVHHKWAMENIPTLKEENFTTALDNYVSKIDFQLSRILYPDEPVKQVMNNWFNLSEELLKDPDFGESLSQNNDWLQDEAKKITAGTATQLDAAKKIFEYVRNNMNCTDNTAKYLSNPIKKVFQVKNGNVADINLLLTATLLQSGIEAHPVLLSTRGNGKALENYPILDRLNYVISQAKIDGKTYLLDASHNKLGFGCLPVECYNGFARVIDKDLPVLINLSADSISESKRTSVFIINDEKGGLTGTFTSNLGTQESNVLREKLVKTNQDDYFKGVKKAFSFDIDVSNTAIDSLKMYEQPIAVKYDFKFDTDEEIFYFNPVFDNEYKENPFKAEERFYPVELPYAMNDVYYFRMDIPKGYKVDELPKSAKVSLNENEGTFEYLIAKDENIIQLRLTLKLNKANFEPEDYKGLKDFFAFISKKQSEQIVLKKI